MSSTGRTTAKGGKGPKGDKSHKTDGGKGGGDKVSNKENIKMEVSIKEKVQQLMDLTHFPEDQVCWALHESDNDMNTAMNFLYEENAPHGEWETKDKRKKKRQASAGKQEKKDDEGAGGQESWDEGPSANTPGNNVGGGDGREWKERSGARRDNRSGGGNGPPRRWREEGSGGRGGDRRGGGRGLTRGAGGARGRGGGRAGGRYPPRGNRSGGGRDYNRQPIETWDSSNTWDNSTAAAAPTTNHVSSTDDWDDLQTDEWSTEEYTGSLVETKVFTPSCPPILQDSVLDTSTAGQNLPALDQNLSSATHQDNTYSQSLGQTYNQTVPQLPSQPSPVPPLVGTLTPAQTQYFSQLSQQNSDALGKPYVNTTTYQTPQNSYDAKTNVPPVYNNTSQVYPAVTQAYSNATQQQYANNPAQTYSNSTQSYSNAAQPYGSAVAQQPPYSNNTSSNATSQQPYNATQPSYGNQATTPYNSAVSQTYGSTQPSYGGSAGTNSYAGTYQTGATTYGAGQEVQQVHQPQRSKTQRARVPPPSKIPASAVEMPGDLNSSVTFLDVQFGAMDLIDTSFDANSEVKFGNEPNRNSAAVQMDNSRSTPSSAELNSSGTNNSGCLGADTGYSSGSANANNTANSNITAALSQGLASSDNSTVSSDHLNYNNTAAPRSTSQEIGSSVTTSVPSVTTASTVELSKQPTDGQSEGSTNGYSYSSQAASYNAYQQKSNVYNSLPYVAAQATTSAYVGGSPSGASYANQANSYAAGVQNSSAGSNSYGNAYSSAAAATQAYPAAAYASVTQTPNSYQTGGQPSYASAQNSNSQSVYGANAGLSNNANFPSASNQYNSYNSTPAVSGHKLGSKENSYDSSNAAGSVTSTASSNIAASSTVAMSSLSQTTMNSKTTAALAKNSTSVMSNIPPPGVTPVMSTPYIMGQVPYFQQPVYSFEDMQLLQQRLPHLPTPYYDISYQTPTTLATVRDPTAALGGYGAATGDGRFQTAGRAGDGTTSPVPAASQQQQQQQPPILAAAAGTAPPYFFATAFNTITAAPPNYPQFGTMYTQLPTVTNAHGSSGSSQYGPKPATYGSGGYGGYDSLGQSAQDYAKGGYAVGTAAAAQQAAQKGQTNSGTTPGSAGNDISAMYGKSHAALSKVNSYEKQGFHSGTPPPFTGALNQSAGLAPTGTGYPPQVYIPTMPQHHNAMAMHQPLHQMDVRHQGRRADSGNSSGQRSQGSNQSKTGSKQGYGASYWNQN
uniref:UBA domain-containing protein n=1 Tax=Dendroctonus ponderosae TaxID=77166 RepID=A0AAR5QK45_DENPD